MSISFVQAAANAAPVATLNLTGITVGNLLVVWGRFAGAAGTPTFVDASGNTWTLSDVIFSNGGTPCRMWYCLAATATTAQLTFSSAGTFPEIIILEYHASTGTWSFPGSSVTATGSQGSGTWSASAKTVTVGDLVLGLFENETANGIVFSTAGAWTFRVDSDGNACASDKVAASTTETPQVGANATATVGSASVNFRASSPAAPKNPAVVIMT